DPGSNSPIARGELPGCNGLDGDFYSCSDTSPAVPRATRIFRGIEVVGRKSFSERFWLQASYLYSSVRGNYDGEVSQVFPGQTDPGINGDFDYPAFFYNSAGRLYQDRPHSL